MVDKILKSVMEMEMGETNTFKITENRFLFVDNWSAGDGDNFASLELNSGEETKETYSLDEILECGTYDFGNKEEIRSGIEYMINCCK